MTLFDPMHFAKAPGSRVPPLEERQSAPASGVVLGPTNRIILQDLNVALSANFREMRRTRSFAGFIRNVERYHVWLTRLLEPEYVILITARNERWADLTLSRIERETGWQPDEVQFSRNEGPAEVLKHEALIDRIFPVHGDDPTLYYAVESNRYTREMYASHGIVARDAYRGGPEWETLA